MKWILYMGDPGLVFLLELDLLGYCTSNFLKRKQYFLELSVMETDIVELRTVTTKTQRHH